VTKHAVLNANYIRAALKGIYPCPLIASAATSSYAKGISPDAEGIHALDISKRLMDYGIHPPTNYFPLIVPEAC